MRINVNYITGIAQKLSVTLLTSSKFIWRLGKGASSLSNFTSKILQAKKWSLALQSSIIYTFTKALCIVFSENIQFVHSCNGHENEVPNKKDDTKLSVQFPVIDMTSQNQKDHCGKETKGGVK